MTQSDSGSDKPEREPLVARRKDMLHRQLRKQEIYRLHINGMNGEEILETLNTIPEGADKPRFPVQRRQLWRDIRSIRQDIVKKRIAEHDEEFINDLEDTIESLKFDKRINLRMMANAALPPDIRQRAIELDALLTITILKVKYEGKAFIKGLSNVRKEVRVLQQQANTYGHLGTKWEQQREPIPLSDEAIFR